MKYLILSAVLVGSAFVCPAQQTIFNVPNTDVLDKGKVYAELDILFKPADSSALNKFSSVIPRIVAGVGRGVEIGLNLTGNIQPGSDSTTLVPSVKYRFYQNGDKSLALIAGSNIHIPVRNRAYRMGTWSYLAGSKSVRKTRLTAGAYVATKNVFAANATRGGGQFGLEQTVNSKLSVAVDWITGKHGAGFLTPGLIYKPKPRITTYWSYSIGNTGASEGNHFFLLEVGFNFN